MDRTYLRGDLYYADLGRGIGSEQAGYRPTVIIAPISGKTETRLNFPVHCQLEAECGLTVPSLVLLEQLRTIDKRRLETYIGHLDGRHVQQVNHALAVSVGLMEV